MSWFSPIWKRNSELFLFHLSHAQNLSHGLLCYDWYGKKRIKTKEKRIVAVRFQLNQNVKPWSGSKCWCFQLIEYEWRAQCAHVVSIEVFLNQNRPIFTMICSKSKQINFSYKLIIIVHNAHSLTHILPFSFHRFILFHLLFSVRSIIFPPI